VAERAAVLLHGGHSVVVDAVFARPEARTAIEHVASAASVPFMGLWLDAPESVLISRVEGRRNDPSDADAAVIRAQRDRDIGHMQWSRIDASHSPEAVLSNATDRLRGELSLVQG